MKFLKENIFQVVLFFILLNLTLAAEFWGAQLHDRYSFWAAAKSFIAGINPYNLEEVRAYVETCCMAEFPDTLERVWGLPIILPLVSWFAFFSFKTFLFSHAIVSSFVIVVCYFFLRRLFSVNSFSGLPFYLESIALISFYPAYVTLIVGPAIMYVLFGITVYLYCVKKTGSLSNTFLGGFFLSLILIKPHLLFLLCTLVLSFSIVRKEWKTFFGIVFGFVCLVLSFVIISPKLIFYYIEMFREFPVNLFLTPTLANYLQQSFSLPAAIRFLPAVLGIIFYLVYFLKNGKNFRACGIEKDFSLIMSSIVISLILAPYLWVYDFLPLLVVLIYYFSKEANRTVTLGLIMFFAHVLLWLIAIPMHYSVWYPYVFLILFILRPKISLRR